MCIAAGPLGSIHHQTALDVVEAHADVVAARGLGR
jgi:hypothetical protein